jgi:hypothetical protein
MFGLLDEVIALLE